MIAFLLSLLVCWNSATADSVYSYPNNPVGAYQNAVGLGGISRSASAEMLFFNPACLGDIQINDITVSLSSAAVSQNPSIAFAGRFSALSVLGAGYKVLEVNGSRENYFIISSSFTPTPFFWPGANIKYIVYQNQPALDMDVGFAWNPLPKVRLCAFMDNTFGSGFDNKLNIKRGRTVAFQSQYFWSEHGVDGCNAYIKSDLNGYSISAGAGIEKRFFVNPQIGFRAGVYYRGQDSVPSGLTLGFIYQHDIKEQRLSLEYAYIPPTGSKADRHNISLHFGFFGAVDRIPPDIFIETNMHTFSPDGDGVNDMLLFRLKASDNPGGIGLKSWALILAAKGQDNQRTQVKAFSGSGAIPSTIAWDGRNSQDKLVPHGTYYYMFTAEDKNSNRSKTGWTAIQVK